MCQQEHSTLYAHCGHITIQQPRLICDEAHTGEHAFRPDRMVDMGNVLCPLCSFAYYPDTSDEVHGIVEKFRSLKSIFDHLQAIFERYNNHQGERADETPAEEEILHELLSQAYRERFFRTNPAREYLDFIFHRVRRLYARLHQMNENQPLPGLLGHDTALARRFGCFACPFLQITRAAVYSWQPNYLREYIRMGLCLAHNDIATWRPLPAIFALVEWLMELCQRMRGPGGGFENPDMDTLDAHVSLLYRQLRTPNTRLPARRGFIQGDHLGPTEALKALDIMTDVDLESLTDNEYDRSCSICLRGFGSATDDETAEGPVRLRCGHIFGSHCIQIWLTSNSVTCPMCRHDLSAAVQAQNLP